ncbi:MAG: DUF2062 domain-containing protein [Micavibrio sp.]|nr:MAG: DUF2062 domain-containing protein [Micavibrio sp.]
MFKRRNSKPLLHKIRDVFWPYMGWERLVDYYKHRVGRMKGTPYMIAAGFASGAAVSFTPLMGFHFILGILLALAVRGSLLASMFGTAVGNPWTFPIIWLIIYRIGRFILGEDDNIDIDGEDISTGLTLGEIRNAPSEFFFPAMVGSIPCIIVVWFVVFFPVRKIVAQYQRRRRLRLERKRQRKKRRKTLRAMRKRYK